LQQVVTRIVFAFIFLFSFYHTNAQDSCRLQVSIITCGTGEDLYSIYGHSAVRIIDSCNESDIVYNYGTFNFSDPDFYIKFTRGKLDYYVDSDNFSDFMGTYVFEGRSVQEQVLNLNQKDAKQIQLFLNENLKEENKNYKYDFLFNNCSTKIRDIFTNLFKGRYEYGSVIPNDSMSFKTVLDYYERNLHWERVGIDLLMSNIVDRKMTNYESMFLPDYLMKGFAKATLDGNKLVKETKLLLAEKNIPTKQTNFPLLIFWAFFALIFLMSNSPIFSKYLKYFDIPYFFILGILGTFILFMWLGTDHKVCAWNRNLLWAFPLHFIFAFLITFKSEKISQYARYASWLIVLCVLFGLFAAQTIPMELYPLILITYIRLIHYKKMQHQNTFSFMTFNDLWK
jgi:hypothetical protein